VLRRDAIARTADAMGGTWPVPTLPKRNCDGKLKAPDGAREGEREKDNLK
jgi:hypothetical protein